MKKRLLAALVSVLLVLACLPALAAQVPDGVFRLICRDAQGKDTLLGTAVLVEDTTLLTAAGIVQCEGQLIALGADGEYPVLASVIPPTLKSAALLGLMEAPPAAVVPLAQSAQTVYWAAVREDGTLDSAQVKHASATTFSDQECLLYTAEAGLLPGGVLLSESGELLGLTLGAYAEGVDRYVALAGAEIGTILPGTGNTVSVSSASWLHGFTLSAADGWLHVDWKDCGVSLTEGEQLTVIVYDTANAFVDCLTPQDGVTDIHQPVVPGRTYEVCIQRSTGELDLSAGWDDSDLQRISIPDARPFDLYSMCNEELYLGSVPAGQAGEAQYQKVEPLPALTAPALSSGEQAVFLQAVSTYTVQEEVSSLLVAALLTPDGQCFSLDGGFLFMPELCGGDVWNIDVTELFEGYLRFSGSSAMDPGEYRLCFYLDGALAGELTWILE